jgi:MFS transporter, DHA1 family, inner membrane transport protein
MVNDVREVAHEGWGPTSVSAGVLSLASLGDVLLYVVLPVSAASFGVGFAWVGVLLAANRLTRIVLYGAVAAFGERAGSRMLAIVSATAAAASTFILWKGDGGPVLLAARVVWGLAFAGLSLAALSYAVADRGRAGSRVGVSRAINQMGPALSLSVGAWLAGVLGPRDVFLVLGLVSLLAVPLAFTLPKDSVQANREKTQWLPKPKLFDLFFFVVGFAVDGVFAMTVALLLAKSASPEAAMLAAGLILALRRFGEVLLAPVGGFLGDRLGTGKVLFLSAVLLAGGFAVLAMGSAYFGSVIVIAARAAIAALGPAVVAQRANGEATLHRLAVMQTWRDFGAAVGPLVTGILLGMVGLGLINAVLVVLVAASLLTLRRPKQA